MIIELTHAMLQRLNQRFVRIPIGHYVAIAALQELVKEQNDEPTNSQLRELWTLLRSDLSKGLSKPGS